MYRSMNRSIFQIIFFLLLILTSSNIIQCTPPEFFTKQIFINSKPCFCYSSEIEQILVERDLRLFIKNFDSISYNLVKYLNYDNTNFHFQHPNSHFNLMMSLQNENLDYCYSIPFSHKNIITNPQYYEYVDMYDWNVLKRNQYFRPYVSINQFELIKINKFNINPYNYMKNTDMVFKFYRMFKMYGM